MPCHLARFCPDYGYFGVLRHVASDSIIFPQPKSVTPPRAQERSDEDDRRASCELHVCNRLHVVALQIESLVKMALSNKLHKCASIAQLHHTEAGKAMVRSPTIKTLGIPHAGGMHYSSNASFFS